MTGSFAAVIGVPPVDLRCDPGQGGEEIHVSLARARIYDLVLRALENKRSLQSRRGVSRQAIDFAGSGELACKISFRLRRALLVHADLHGMGEIPFRTVPSWPRD